MVTKSVNVEPIEIDTLRATARGLKVALVEQGDWASATSSARMRSISVSDSAVEPEIVIVCS